MARGQLTALGYEVFADVLRLKGGDDWERILEFAIRDKAAKFLLAATPHGVQKQGVRNEITIATETAKRISDKSFIVPLRLAPLGFIDPDIPWLGSLRLISTMATRVVFASQVSGWARGDATLRQRLFALCETAVSPVARSLLAAIMDDFGTGDALLAGLGIVNDRLSPTVPYDLFKGLENLFLERRPYGGTSSAFVYAPRRADEIRAKLFAMVLSDPTRRRTAFSLLGQIEVWRLEYGRPDNEPRHPSFDLGQPWPPIALIKEHAL